MKQLDVKLCSHLLGALRGVLAEIAMIPSINLQIVEANSLRPQSVHHLRRTHLAKIEWLASDVVMKNVRHSKVEAERLQRIEQPVVDHLILEEHVLFGNVAIVVHACGHNLQRCLTKHVGEEEKHAHIRAERVHTLRHIRGEE